MPSDYLTLGEELTTSRPVRISQQTHTLSTYLIGRPGHGKSHVMTSMILDDIEHCRGGVVVLDPHGTLVEAVVNRIPGHRYQDVILLDCGDRSRSFGLNLFDCADRTDPAAVSFAVNQFVDVFRKIWTDAWGARLEALLRNIGYLAMEHLEFTLVDVPRLLDDAVYRKTLTMQLVHPTARAYWERFEQLTPHQRSERTESTMVRVDAFLSNLIIYAIVGQQTTIDFQAVARGDKLLFVDLGSNDIGPDGVSLLGSILVNRLVGELQQRNKEEPVIHLYADEVQRYVSPVFSTIFNEMRKFGLAPTVANQVLADLEPAQRSALLGANTLVVFSVGGEGDARVLSERFTATTTMPEPVRARDPWNELDRSGHRNTEVMQGYKKVNDHISQFEILVERANGASWTGARWVIYQNEVDRQLVRRGAEWLENSIRLLVMAHQEDTEPNFTGVSKTVWNEIRQLVYAGRDRILQATRDTRVQWDEKLGLESSIAAWGNMMTFDLCHLIRLLNEHPFWAPEWEAAQLSDPRRMTADQIAENANLLGRLPQFIAWVSSGDRDGRSEYQMRTIPLPEVTPKDLARTVSIKYQSKQQYTRPRTEIEAEIRERRRTFDHEPNEPESRLDERPDPRKRLPR